MKTLLLFRHADAASGRDYATDHERPLTPRGRGDAQQMGRFLTATAQHPDHAVASTATRAQQTLKQARAGGGWSGEHAHAENALYDASSSGVLNVVQAAPDEADRLLLVGHNPTFTDVAIRLIGGGNLKMATGTIARIDLPIDAWGDAAFKRGQLRWLLGPKQLPR
jgi:phosphohistidine phosphatase